MPVLFEGLRATVQTVASDTRFEDTHPEQLFNGCLHQPTAPDLTRRKSDRAKTAFRRGDAKPHPSPNSLRQTLLGETAPLSSPSRVCFVIRHDVCTEDSPLGSEPVAAAGDKAAKTAIVDKSSLQIASLIELKQRSKKYTPKIPNYFLIATPLYIASIICS